MPVLSELTVRPVDTVPWHDVRTVFGIRGDPAGCWCQFFKLSNADWKDLSREDCSEMLRDQIAASPPAPGVLAYLGDEPVGWCAIEPRPNYSRLKRMPLVEAGGLDDVDDASVWAVTCFVVRVGFRKRGVSAALLDGALDHARAHDARIVEAYPVNAAERPGVSSADLYHGPLSLFESAGFTVVARPAPARAVVQLRLTEDV